MLFISHANPEDNDFSLWLSLQLAREGYPNWCDLTKLLGGEAFWSNIEDAIRNRSSKFLYVLSRASNQKQGPLDELQVAKNVQRDLKLRDFVIPLSLDDLPPREANIRLSNLQFVPFHPNWADGLAQLLTKLRDEHVPTKASFGPSSVSDWWRQHAGADAQVLKQPERLVSNWFPLTESPQLWFHELRRSTIGRIQLPKELPYPCVQHEHYAVSFAGAHSLEQALGSELRLGSSFTHVPGPQGAGARRPWSFKQERAALASLLRQAWTRMVRTRALPAHLFANEAPCFYFHRGMLPGNRVVVPPSQGRDQASHRQVVGFKSIKARDGSLRGLRYWHFGIEAKPMTSPVLGYTLKPHVLFSDDGETIWESPERLHRARRSQCRNWWNDDWRDRILGSVAWLAGSSRTLRLEVGDNTALDMSTDPVQAVSPVSYVEPGHEPLDSGSGEDDDEVEADVEDGDATVDDDAS